MRSPSSRNRTGVCPNIRGVLPWRATTRDAGGSYGRSPAHRPSTADPRVHRASHARTGYPPSVREIGEAVGLGSPSTVHSHLSTLQRLGFLRRDPDEATGHRGPLRRLRRCAAVERRPVRHVPLVGEVAAGTDVLAQENVEEVMPVPADLTGDGELFMLRVRGDSMIDAGILDGDYVVARTQPPPTTARSCGRHPRRGRPRSRRTTARATRSCSSRPTRASSRCVRPCRGHDLRSGGHRDAPGLIQPRRLVRAWPPPARSGPSRGRAEIVGREGVDDVPSLSIRNVLRLAQPRSR